jgi:hypothetical protein
VKEKSQLLLSPMGDMDRTGQAKRQEKYGRRNHNVGDLNWIETIKPQQQ